MMKNGAISLAKLETTKNVGCTTLVLLKEIKNIVLKEYAVFNSLGSTKVVQVLKLTQLYDIWNGPKYFSFLTYDMA